MPAGIGYPGGGAGGLAAEGSDLGIPQPGAIPGNGGVGGIDELLTALTSGGLSPEKLLALLALVAGGGVGQGQGQLAPPGPPPQGLGPGGPGGPIGAALGGGAGGGFPPL